ncbi:MAG: 2-dehydropantoate 2-reductase [Syntrophus sp. (in: bacteria)]|nr:2-dehydropantoate 2-reductase [Syntrophus sp. (in: bacteria)]
MTLKTAIIGIGGIGGYYGGKLAAKYAGDAEHKITFIARGEHLKAIQNRGLQLLTVEGDLTAVPALAVDNPHAAGLFDLVLVCVKSYGLEEAARRIKDNIHDETVIIPLLNGVNAAERLKAIMPKGRILGGCVYISARIESPGVVRQVGGSCQFIFGPDQANDVEKYRPIEAFLQEAGIKAELVGRIALPLWTKYIFIDPLAGLTSMLGKPFGAILDNPIDRSMLEGLMQEVELVARAQGVPFPDDIVQSTIAKAAAFPATTKTSMLLDFEKGNPAELDIFMGYMVVAAKKLDIPVPLHEKVYGALLKKTG